MKTTKFLVTVLLMLGALHAEVRATDVCAWRNDGNGLYPADCPDLRTHEKLLAIDSK